MEKIAIYSLVALVLFTRLSDVVSSPSTHVSGHGVVEASAAGMRTVKLKLSPASGVPKPKLPLLSTSHEKERSDRHREKDKTKNAFDESTCPDCSGDFKNLKEFCNRRYHYGIEATVLERDAKGYRIEIENVHRNRTGVPIITGQRLHVRFEERNTQNLQFSRCPCPNLLVNESYFMFGKLKYHSKSRKHFFTISRASRVAPVLISAARTCQPDIPKPPPTIRPVTAVSRVTITMQTVKTSEKGLPLPSKSSSTARSITNSQASISVTSSLATSTASSLQ